MHRPAKLVTALLSPVWHLLGPGPRALREPERGGDPAASTWPHRDAAAQLTWLTRRLQQDPGALQALQSSFDLEWLATATTMPGWLSLPDGWLMVARDCLDGRFVLDLAGGTVAHVSRDGRCGALALSLPEWLAVLRELPSWRDLLEFSSAASLTQMRELAPWLQLQDLQDLPDLPQHRQYLGTALALEAGAWPDCRPSVGALERLHHAVHRLPAPAALVDGRPCTPLPGERSPSDFQRLTLSS